MPKSHETWRPLFTHYWLCTLGSDLFGTYRQALFFVFDRDIALGAGTTR